MARWYDLAKVMNMIGAVKHADKAVEAGVVTWHWREFLCACLDLKMSRELGDSECYVCCRFSTFPSKASPEDIICAQGGEGGGHTGISEACSFMVLAHCL